jgi:hypothetical protein
MSQLAPGAVFSVGELRLVYPALKPFPAGGAAFLRITSVFGDDPDGVNYAGDVTEDSQQDIE